ncbi:MAG: hypothetical protein mread185_000032 [Mycoplasmataceae bacterium]|nr:MAG: hypothetical protein mread185_000032 [Mycoplasmataceae bacterium]
MLCSRCYEKIPEGQEVAKTTGYWKVNGWGRWGNEIFCKECAIKQDKQDLIFMICFFGSFLIFPIIWMILYLIVKK